MAAKNGPTKLHTNRKTQKVEAGAVNTILNVQKYSLLIITIVYKVRTPKNKKTKMREGFFYNNSLTAEQREKMVVLTFST